MTEQDATHLLEECLVHFLAWHGRRRPLSEWAPVHVPLWIFTHGGTRDGELMAFHKGQTHRQIDLTSASGWALRSDHGPPDESGTADPVNVLRLLRLLLTEKSPMAEVGAETVERARALITQRMDNHAGDGLYIAGVQDALTEVLGVLDGDARCPCRAYDGSPCIRPDPDGGCLDTREGDPDWSADDGHAFGMGMDTPHPPPRTPDDLG